MTALYASTPMKYSIRTNCREGIQEDLSYHQHGPQLYIGGYGTVFVDNIVRIGHILNGTKYAMNPEKLNLFSNFIRNTYFKRIPQQISGLA